MFIASYIMTPACFGLLVPKLGKNQMLRDSAISSGQFCISFKFSEGFGTFQIPKKLTQNKSDTVHLGHGFVFFLNIQSSNICDAKSYFSKNVIFLRESVARLCAFSFKTLQYLFEKSAVIL